MPKISCVKLFKRIKINEKWMLAQALFDSKGRLRRDHVRVQGKDETHAEGSYFIEWWDRGKRYREAVGPDGFQAADKARTKQAELSAVRNGILPAPVIPPPELERTTVAEAIERYSEYIKYHRSFKNLPHLPTDPGQLQILLHTQLY
jgi:hypothetical protein